MPSLVSIKEKHQGCRERRVGAVLHVTKYLTIPQNEYFQTLSGSRIRRVNCSELVIPSYVPIEVHVSAVVVRWDEERLTALQDLSAILPTSQISSIPDWHPAPCIPGLLNRPSILRP
jgi:hypothetical protein